MVLRNYRGRNTKINRAEFTMYLAVEKYSSILGSIFDDADIQGSLIVL